MPARCPPHTQADASLQLLNTQTSSCRALNPPGTQHHLQHAHDHQQVSTSVAEQLKQRCRSALADTTQHAVLQVTCRYPASNHEALYTAAAEQASCTAAACRRQRCCTLHSPAAPAGAQAERKQTKPWTCAWLLLVRLAHPRSSTALPAHPP
jgi:hypothetical protein